MKNDDLNLCTECGLKHGLGECLGRPNLDGYPVVYEAEQAKPQPEPPKVPRRENIVRIGHELY